MSVKWVALAAMAAASSLVSAETAQFNPSKDNTLFESATGGLSSGLGQLFVGATNGGELRRALVQFDLTSTIPAGAAVTDVNLRITQDRHGPAGSGLINVHRLAATWGEGTSNGSGGGGLATTGDATWTHRFHDTTLWTTPGGDFDASVLASLAPSGSGNQTITSTPALVSAVQGWLVAPASNAGFVLKEGTATAGTASRFLSRESTDANTRPLLTVSFDRPTTTWLPDANGAWSDSANWSAGVPASFGVIARFAGPLAAPRTVSLNTGLTTGQLLFDSPIAYTLAGSGTLTLDNGNGFDARIDVANGSHEVSVPVASSRNVVVNTNGSSQLNVADLVTTATLSKSGSGRLELGTLSAASLDIQSGTLAVTSSTAAVVGGLSISGGSSIDLRHGGLIQESDAGSIDAALALRVQDIVQNRIASSEPLLIGSAKAGDIPNLATFMNRPVPAFAVLLRATFAGDGNLDGAVNFDDLLALAQSYGTLSGARWVDGDSNRDGKVDFDDLLALAQRYGSSLVNGSVSVDTTLHDSFAGDWQRALSLAPEPMSMFAGLVLIGRRRRG